MYNQFSFTNLFPNFKTGDLDQEELERIIRDAVARECPENSIVGLDYSEDGIEVKLDNGDLIEIEIDWNEIILK